jgi:phage tail sheath protein FI
METLYPGLYFQEVAGTKPIEATSTAIGAFVGTAPKGKIGEPVLVTNWTEFVKNFGGYDKNSYLAYAVRGFFENGGSRAYISRVVHFTGGVKSSSPAKYDLLDSLGTVTIKVSALYDGSLGNQISVEVSDVVSESGTFTLKVYNGADVVEVYKDTQLTTVDADTKGSEYISVFVMGQTLPVVLAKKSLTGGTDGLTDITDADFLGDESSKAGLHAFDNVNINMVAIPSLTTLTGLQGIVAYAEGRKDCFAILDAPYSMIATEVADFRTTANLSSDYAGLYYPYVEVSDPIGIGKSPTKFVPPSGHVMGVIARTDNSLGVWRAPAGTDVSMLGVVGLKYYISNTEQGILNPLNINCIRSFAEDGICIWGARTLKDGDYKYISVRRLSMYIEQSLMNNMRWTTFKTNDSRLWGMIKTSVESFLTNIWSNGGLKGEKSSEAFFVKCDAELNTQSVVDLGQTLVDIGIATQKPSEFIIFRLSLTV